MVGLPCRLRQPSSSGINEFSTLLNCFTDIFRYTMYFDCRLGGNV